MAAPQVPIDVNPDTGVWTSDELPMLFVPRHFLINNHRAMEEALGSAAYARHLHDAGHKSAYHWCRQAAATHSMAGLDVFHHYLSRLSQRGWGQFSVQGVDPNAGTGRVRLDNSAFVLEYGPDAGRPVCYMFEGWFAGALEWAAHDRGAGAQVTAREVCCAAAGNDHCEFEISPL
jgi:predicted hydrocarbon binding protein